MKSQNKLKKEDLRWLELLRKPEEQKPMSSIPHNYIHLPLDRKFIGMTKKERELIEEKNKNEE